MFNGRFDKLNDLPVFRKPLPEPVEGSFDSIMKPGYLYILECADGSFYTGSTVDLKRRLDQHRAFQGARYTARKWPLRLVYWEYYSSIVDAFRHEKQIQGWSHAKKRALIAGHHEKLQELARNRQT